MQHMGLVDIYIYIRYCMNIFLVRELKHVQTAIKTQVYMKCKHMLLREFIIG